jgi:LuxR family transcriptional regulator, maltose regulon positive regulatory protein
VARLDHGIRNALTLLSAPAGWGKSSLLAEWLAVGDQARDVVRLRLGPEADGLRSFWRTLCEAVPELAHLEPPARGAKGGFGARVLEALDARAEPLVIVLDDFQVVGSAEVGSDLDWLLENGGERLRLLVASRTDPPLRLERLRMTGRMTEVRAADLAFTLPEAAELLDGLELSDADIELLWRRTEGWVGGLRLAQLSLEGRSDGHEFVTSFAGDDRAVSDYLISEVVDRQAPDTLEFLLRTCIADRLSAELADALTGGHDGQ